MRYGLIAGSGRFPLLALEQARKLGHEMVVVAIRGEASEAVEHLAGRTYWITVAELGKLISTLQQEQITEVILAGQVKHANLFSSLRPDWRLARLLYSLKERNTESLIGGLVAELAREGIRVLDSTALLKPLLASEGVLTRRRPTADEEKDVTYGRRIAAALSAFDLGQSVAVCERACVALEAMEGTDAMLRRAASLGGGRRLSLVKASGRRGHLLFDVPVTGPDTIAVMREAGASILAVDAGRTLLLDKDQMLGAADEAGICVAGYAALEQREEATT